MENKTVLVTVATSGIGLALIDSLLKSGFTPILTARNTDKMRALAADMIVTMLIDESMVWSQVGGRALKDYV